MRPRSFNSRTPGGVRLRTLMVVSDGERFQFTHPRRGATSIFGSSIPLRTVSIHAPQEGCDLLFSLHVKVCKCVSIHAPQEGCDPSLHHRSTFARPFQFTHPRRGATGVEHCYILRIMFQFTHPRRGATSPLSCFLDRLIVSIHAPQEGCDCTLPSSVSALARFNSRTPGGVRLRSSP